MADRVWERFLTEQDRAHVAMKPPKRIGFGERPALLLIDLYRWVFGDKPEPMLNAIKTWPGSCGLAGWNALPHIQTLLKSTRQVGIPIIHVTGLAGAGVDEWSFRRDEKRDKASSPDELERRRHKFDIIDEVAPLPGEAVLKKLSPSAFWGTPLVGHLNQLNIDTLITCGESTSGCVRASVVDGTTYRFRMIVVEECVFDRHEAAHAINLFDMNQKYADVLPLAEVLDYLASRRAKREEGRSSDGNGERAEEATTRVQVAHR
ncbi:MAG TPA: isochorismatase family protein [Candidatus Binatia bacterium]|jgi:nicotinamidase-related amidase|nr:isochorismatase family protein [Candidatus Binatia bacterium]